MVTVPRIISLCVAVAALLGLAANAPSNAPGQQGPRPTTPIEHFVVIQLENWSFDSLFGTFPGADGFPRTGTPTPYPQTDKLGIPLTGMAGPPCRTPTPTTTPRPAGATPLPSGCFPPTMSPVPFNLATYLDRNLHIPPDSIHEFFREQFQIDGGRMDQFPIWNDVATPCAEYCAGASLGYWDLASLPTTTPSIAHYARQYTLMDKYHHGMFGASVPNWFWLICSCAIVWPTPVATNQAPVILVTQTPRPAHFVTPIVNGTPEGFGSVALLPGPSGAPVYYVVDNPPGPSRDGVNGPPLQTLTTIGDRMDARGVTWAWYWDAHQHGVEGIPPPWIWFANYTTGTAGYDRHVIGGTPPPTDTPRPTDTATTTRTPGPGTPSATPAPTQSTTATATQTATLVRSLTPTVVVTGPDLFLTAVAANTLPQVSFIQPGTDQSYHPGSATFADVENFVAGRLLPAIMNSQAYRENKVAILITFDENGGRWDHVPPPRGTPFVTDQFGPGSRIPSILISPWAKQCHVDHTYYDSSAVKAFIERNWNLTPISTRDAIATPLSGGFDFSAPLQPIDCSGVRQTPPTATRTPSTTATATATATPTPLSVAQAISQVAASLGRSGQTGVASASAVGETVAVTGAVTGTGTVTGSMAWRLTATVPGGIVPGTVPIAVFSTLTATTGPAQLEGFACAAVAAGVGTVTCAGTTVGNALQGSTVTVMFGPGVVVTGTVNGPGPRAAGIVVVPPALPPGVPPPPLLLPPGPLLPVPPVLPPFAPGGDAPFAEVPVVPEAESLLLLGSGLTVLGALVGWRRSTTRRARGHPRG